MRLRKRGIYRRSHLFSIQKTVHNDADRETVTAFIPREDVLHDCAQFASLLLCARRSVVARVRLRFSIYGSAARGLGSPPTGRALGVACWHALQWAGGERVLHR